MIIGRNKTQFKLGPTEDSMAYHNYSDRPQILALNRQLFFIDRRPRNFFNRNLTKDDNTNKFTDNHTQLKYEEKTYYRSFREIISRLGRFSI